MLTSCDIVLDHEGRLPLWSKPTTSKYGLYVFRAGPEIIRVGETSSGCDRIIKGFREPFRRQLRGKDRKNYLAYSWRAKHANTKIALDFFNLEDEPFSDNYLRRALEAEVTFQLRINMRHWPREMSEIHFQEHRRCDPNVVQKASHILATYNYRYLSDI